MPKKLPKYGEDYKKIMFYDSDKRHADLKIRLQYDGLKQNEFFRAVMTAYLDKDNDFMKFIDRYREDNEVMDKTKLRKQNKTKKQEKEIKSKFALKEDEIESIFDLLEEEHPDL